MSPVFEFTDELPGGALRRARYATERGVLTTYSVVLTAWRDGREHTVRSYDNAHGQNEMHRHTLSGGKQPAEVFHHGSASEAMNAAWDEIKTGYEEMIAGWLR
jgi:hypothetical protein